MKKLILFLIILVVAVTGISCAVGPVDNLSDEGGRSQRMDAAPSSLSVVSDYHKSTADMETFNPIPSQNVVSEPVVNEIDTPAEQSQFRDDIPLPYEEQEYLQDACEEFEVPYALALGLIEKETNFRNVVGDDGASTGYMQIQQRWHWDRMERLGVTDLMDPSGNFRVGLDFLSELYGRYEDWSLALTVYNMGHNPGYITDYANEVMDNYANWQKLINTDN